MDPSEIIQVPYNLKRLQVFTMAPVVIIVFLAMIDEPTKLFSYLVTLFRLIAVSYAMLGLFGANIVDNYQHSIYTAIYVAALLMTTTRRDSPSSKLVEQLPFYDSSDLISQCRLYGMLGMNIPFQILQVLDWGIQVQRWPVPVLLGISYGYILGTFLGMFANYLARKRIEARVQEARRSR